MTERLRVYVAGPVGPDDDGRRARVHEAIRVADTLWSMGLVPFVPHLFHYWDAIYPHSYSEWMSIDEAWLRTCHAVYRMAGASLGADQEVALAGRLGLPVMGTFDQVQDWLLKRAAASLKLAATHVP